MKRKRPEDRSETWKPQRSLRVYLDDVESIFQIVQDVDPNARGQTQDYVDISGADELQSLGPGTLSRLTLHAARDSVSVLVVRLTRNDTGVWISARDDNALYAALERLKKRLEACQRRFGKWDPPTKDDLHVAWYPGAAALVAALVGVVASIGAATSTETGTSGAFWGWAVAMGLVLAGFFGYVVWGLVWGVNPNPSSTVVLAWRADAPTFWERHRVAIAIGLFTNILVAGLFFLVGLWLA